jgi:hypothetical protein
VIASGQMCMLLAERFEIVEKLEKFIGQFFELL